MSLKSELSALSKRELIRQFIAQIELNTELNGRLKKIEAILNQYDNPNTPSSKKRFKKNTKKDNASDGKRFPGRENGHKGAGIRLPKPDHTIEHKFNQPNLKLIGKRTKTVIDFVDNPIQVTRHIIYSYRDANGNLVFPEVDLPKGIYGKNMQAVVSLLKGKFGASHGNIVDFITSIHDELSFCSATSLTLTDRMAKALAFERSSILKEVREAFYCNADETGLRQDGVSGHVWTFCTPTHVIYETDLSRSAQVPQRVLGKDYENIVVCDGWNAYHGYDRQRCWVHLLRELDALAEDDKRSKAVRQRIKVQANYFHSIYKEALKAKTKPPDERVRFIQNASSEIGLGLMLDALKEIPCCAEFVTKLRNALPYLFTGVMHPEVPLDNNHAERMLRKIVVHRKLMGCIRNEKGALFINNTMSALQTWRLQGKNPYELLKSFAN